MNDRYIKTVTETLAAWTGECVSVRVVVGDDDLIAVSAGRLGELVAEKHPALFWPIDPEGVSWTRPERPGIYLHPTLLESARLHMGEFVLEFAQAGSVLNVRLLTD